MFLLVTSYGLRYVAMSLRVALTEKFPEAQEAEILKVTWILFNRACLSKARLSKCSRFFLSVGPSYRDEKVEHFCVQL